MTSPLDISGKTFNRLTAITRSGDSTSAGKAIWIFKCSCGTEKRLVASRVINGSTKSCGCLKVERSKKAKYVTHGHARKGAHTGTYKAWHGMHIRTRPNATGANRYFHRGIKVCDEWKLFEAFYADMGEQPNGMTLDRINNDLGYFKANCRWATPKQQGNNRCDNVRLVYEGESLTVSQIMEITGLARRKVQETFTDADSEVRN